MTSVNLVKLHSCKNANIEWKFQHMRPEKKKKCEGKIVRKFAPEIKTKMKMSGKSFSYFVSQQSQKIFHVVRRTGEGTTEGEERRAPKKHLRSGERRGNT